jgi:SAM-dependent methyltransferase
MCNVDCVLFAARRLERPEVRGRRVIEVGSGNVNGSLRPLLESWEPGEYVGVDVVPGPGVDQVCSAEELVERFGRDRFDLVVSTEMLEHVRDWRRVVSGMKGVLSAGGTLLLTTRSIGFPYHGYPHDFWRYQPEDLRAMFADMEIVVIEEDSVAPGVFCKARKPAAFLEADLSGIPLHSIVAGRRVRDVDPRDFRRWSYRRAVLRDRLSRTARRAVSRLGGWLSGSPYRRAEPS